MSKLFTRALYDDSISDDSNSISEKAETSSSSKAPSRGTMRRRILQKRFIPLGLLSAHTSLTTFVMQLSRRSGKLRQQPSPALVVLSSELLKIVLCLLWITVQPTIQRYVQFRSSPKLIKTSGGHSGHHSLDEKVALFENDSPSAQQAWRDLSKYIFSAEGFVMIIPSIVYVLQNLLQISAISHMSVVAYQSLCQFKIVATAILSTIILGSKINRRQWICLIILTLGVVDLLVLQKPIKGTSQGVIAKATAALVPSIQYWDVNPFVRKSNGRFASYANLNKAISNMPTTKLAVIAVLLASILGSFSGVYLESRLKRGSSGLRGKKCSLAMKNACLATYSIVTLSVMVFIEHFCRGGAMSQSRLAPFDHWTLLFITLRACGGLLVAASLQYADAISKNFAVCLAIITTSLLEFCFNGRPLTSILNEGTFMILFSSLTYMRIS